MASPVAAILNPANLQEHLLFFLNSDLGQLALEHRPLDQSIRYETFTDNGQSQGIVVVPSSLAAVMHSSVVTVYGIANPGGTGKSNYVSQLSPIFNPIASGTGAVTTQEALAATNDEKGKDYIYYLQLPTGVSQFQIVEFVMVNTNTGVSSLPFGGCFPNADTNLAACYFKSTQDRFVFFERGTSDASDLYWVNSSVGDENKILDTGDVHPSAALAVTCIENTVQNTTTLQIYLYYNSRDQKLTRVVGVATGQEIQWAGPSQVVGAAALQPGSLISVANAGQTNYVYYLPSGSGTSFSPVLDDITNTEARTGPPLGKKPPAPTGH